MMYHFFCFYQRDQKTSALKEKKYSHDFEEKPFQSSLYCKHLKGTPQNTSKLEELVLIHRLKTFQLLSLNKTNYRKHLQDLYVV